VILITFNRDLCHREADMNHPKSLPASSVELTENKPLSAVYAQFGARLADAELPAGNSKVPVESSRFSSAHKGRKPGSRLNQKGSFSHEDIRGHFIRSHTCSIHAAC
jgi:hypothetical protein